MITVTHDQEPNWMPAEPCAFCATPTRFWFAPKDVAVCESCACLHDAGDVPSKRDWLNAQRIAEGKAMLPGDWQCNADRRAILASQAN